MASRLYKLFIKVEADENETLREVNMLNFFMTFFRETTLGGFPMLIKQPGIIKKLFWLGSIAAMSYGLYWECDVFFTKFLSWSPSTSITIETSRYLPFPAITLCNNNPVTGTWYDSTMGVSAPSGGSSGGGASGGASSGGASGSSGSSGVTGASGSSGATGGSGSVSDSTTSSGGTAAPAVTTTTTAGSASSAAGSTPVGKRKRRAATEEQFTQIRQKRQQQQQQQQQAASTGSGGSSFGSIGGSAIPSVQPQQFSSSMKTTLSIQEKASLVALANRSSVGHQLCDMVLECQYAGVTCSPSKAFKTWHWNSQYGNCYTFNPGYLVSETPASLGSDIWTIKTGDPNNNTGVRISTLPGDSYGLYLLLSADTDHYMSSTTQVGWRLTIHNQTEMPFPEESGIFIMPGTSSRVGISLSTIEKLGVVWNGFYNASYSDCVDGSWYLKDDYLNAYSNILEVAYSQSACYKTCYQRAVMSACSCFDFLYPSQGKAFTTSGSNTISPCSYSNTTQWSCKLGVASLYQSDKLNCSDICKETCKSYSISTVLSALKWPNSASSEAMQSVCKTIYDIIQLRTNHNDSTCTGSTNNIADQNGFGGKSVADLFSCSQGIFNDPIDSYYEVGEFIVGTQFAEVYIYYKDFNYQTITESEPTEVADLLAYLGGIVGLFFGFSFMTLMEYIQLILDLILIAIGKLTLLCCKNKTADQPKPDPDLGSPLGSGHHVIKPPSSKLDHVVTNGVSYTTDHMYDSVTAKPATAYYPSNYGQTVPRVRTPHESLAEPQQSHPERQHTANTHAVIANPNDAAAAYGYYSFLAGGYPYPPPPE